MRRVGLFVIWLAAANANQFGRLVFLDLAFGMTVDAGAFLIERRSRASSWV